MVLNDLILICELFDILPIDQSCLIQLNIRWVQLLLRCFTVSYHVWSDAAPLPWTQWAQYPSLIHNWFPHQTAISPSLHHPPCFLPSLPTNNTEIWISRGVKYRPVVNAGNIFSKKKIGHRTFQGIFTRGNLGIVDSGNYLLDKKHY